MRATPKCLGGRKVVDRHRLDPVLLRELYQDRRWSSPQIAAHPASSVKTVPRTPCTTAASRSAVEAAAPPGTAPAGVHERRGQHVPQVGQAGLHAEGNTTTHDDPRPRQPRPTGPKGRRRQDAGAGPGRTPPASGRPIVHHGVAHGGAGTGRRCPPPG